jgi:mevalonate kinase
VEKDELKTGVGQMDFYSCAIGGLIYLDSGKFPPDPIEKYSLPSHLKIIIVDTLTSHNTGKIISWKRQRFLESDSLILEYIKHTEEAIQHIRSILKMSQTNVDLLEIGKTISQCHKYLKDYMLVSTQLIDTCVTESINNGAIGAKLTGSGMGGCMFALVPESLINSVVSLLSIHNVTIYITDISQEGIKVCFYLVRYKRNRFS